MKLVALEISIFARNYWNDYREIREWRHLAHNCNLNTVWLPLMKLPLCATSNSKLSKAFKMKRLISIAVTPADFFYLL